MKKVLIFAILVLAGAAGGLKAFDQHHIWNRTGESIRVDFHYNDPGTCSSTYALLHHTPSQPFGSPSAIPAHPDWLQRIEKGWFNCPLKKVTVVGLSGKIKGKQADYVFTKLAIEGKREPVHFMIDRSGDTISISTGDPRLIYKDNPTLIPELVLQRYDTAAERQTGQKYYYAWDMDRIREKNIKRELDKLKISPNDPSRINQLLQNARADRDKLEKEYQKLTK